MNDRVVTGPPAPAEVYAQVRASIAFEHMVMAVLIAAALSGGVLFALLNAGAVISGRWGARTLLGAAYDAVSFSFIAFLVGFFAAVVVALPLFVTLEKMKRRQVWPFVVAGAAIELVVAAAVLKRVPLVTDFFSPEAAPLLLPGVLAALIFGRRIRPVWRAAEHAEHAPTIFRIH